MMIWIYEYEHEDITWRKESKLWPDSPGVLSPPGNVFLFLQENLEIWQMKIRKMEMKVLLPLSENLTQAKYVQVEFPLCFCFTGKYAIQGKGNIEYGMLLFKEESEKNKKMWISTLVVFQTIADVHFSLLSCYNQNCHCYKKKISPKH